MPVPVDPIRVPIESVDDAKFKRDIERFARDVAAWQAEVESQLNYLKGRVN